MQHARDLVDAVHVLADHGAHGTLQNSAILRRHVWLSGGSVRQSRMSGWMPISRSSFTECCVGLVFTSPAVAMNGTSVRCTYSAFSRPMLEPELADGLEERQRLDVADRAADLDHATSACCGASADAALISSVMCGITCTVAPRYSPAALLADDVRRPCPVVKLLACVSVVDEALVVAEVEVGLGAVVGDEHLAVLERTHGARIDVDIGVELEDRNREPRASKDGGQGRRRCPCRAKVQTPPSPKRHHLIKVAEAPRSQTQG